MTLSQFISENSVYYSKNLVDEKEIKSMEASLQVKFGKELIEYITKYGYLGFESIEMYGVNSKENLNSDMIKKTLYLYKYFPETIGFVAIENQGDGDYYLVDSYDRIYRFLSESGKVTSTGELLFEYILNRFKSCIS